MTIPVQKSPKSRESWIDVAKGWGILLVVLGHALRGLQNAQLLPSTGWSHSVDAWIYAFHMPLFFLLSGFFIEKAVNKPLDRAVKDRAKTLLWPYLVWSLLQTLIQIRMSAYTSTRYEWTHLIGILWKPLMQFWFLYVLLLLSLLWLLLRRARVSPLWLLAAALALHLTQSGSGHWAMWDLVRIHGVWFAAGAVLGIRPELVERLHTSAWRLPGIMLGFGVTAWGAIEHTEALLAANILWALPGVLASLWLAMSLPADARLTASLAWIGKLSLEIFLVHTLASATVRAVLLHGLHIHDATLHLLLASLAGILGPIALVLISRRLHLLHVFRFGRSLEVIYRRIVLQYPSPCRVLRRLNLNLRRKLSNDR